MGLVISRNRVIIHKATYVHIFRPTEKMFLWKTKIFCQNGPIFYSDFSLRLAWPIVLKGPLYAFAPFYSKGPLYPKGQFYPKGLLDAKATFFSNCRFSPKGTFCPQCSILPERDHFVPKSILFQSLFFMFPFGPKSRILQKQLLPLKTKVENGE